MEEALKVDDPAILQAQPDQGGQPAQPNPNLQQQEAVRAQEEKREVLRQAGDDAGHLLQTMNDPTNSYSLYLSQIGMKCRFIYLIDWEDNKISIFLYQFAYKFCKARISN